MVLSNHISLMCSIGFELGTTVIRCLNGFSANSGNGAYINKIFSSVFALFTLSYSGFLEANPILHVVSGHRIDQPVIVNLFGGQGESDLEWIGLFDSADNTLKHWVLTDGVEFGVFDLSSGNILNSGLNRPGQYEIRYFLSDSYEPSAITSFGVSEGVGFSLLSNEKYYKQNQPIDVELLNTPAITGISVGLYNYGELSNENHIWWKYVPDATNGLLTLSAIESPGRYELRVFSNNSYNDILDSVEITVAPTFNVKLNVLNQPIRTGESLNILLPSKLNQNSQDWVGLYFKNENDAGNFLTWEYVNKADTSDILKLQTHDLSPGTYEARLFKSNSYVEAGRVEFDVQQTNISEVTVALISELNWIEPQVFDKISDNKWPVEPIENVVLQSKLPILSATDVDTGENLTVVNDGNGYRVLVPSYTFSKIIKLSYEGGCFTCNANMLLPYWAETELLNGYTALGSGHYYNTGKHSDSFDYGNIALRHLGFNKITRVAKGSTSRFTSLWPSEAIKDSDGNAPLSQLEDSVGKFSKVALENGQSLVAYYKDMGDIESSVSNPDWVCKTPDGESTHARFTMMDFSSLWKEVVYRQIQELSKKGVKGIYFDFIHMPTWGCYGSNMENLFERQTGLESPRRSPAGHHWSNHPNWAKYMEFQNKIIKDAFLYWKSGVIDLDPNFIFIVSGTYISGLTSPIHNSTMVRDADLVKVEFDHGRKKGLRHRVFEKDESDDQNLAKPSDSILTILAHTVPRDFSRGGRFHSWAYGFPNSDQLKGFIVSALSLGGIPDVHIPEQYLASDFNEEDYVAEFESQTPFDGLRDTIEYGQLIGRAFEEKRALPFAGVYFEEDARNALATDYEQAWRKYIWPSVGAYTSFLKAGLPIVALNKNTVAEQLEFLQVIYVPFAKNSASDELTALLAAFEERGGVVIERNLALKWDDPSGTDAAHSIFTRRLESVAPLAPFKIISPSTNAPVYPFFYVQ